MDAATLIDTSRCPNCRFQLPPWPTHCPSCAICLRGARVERLWQVSVQARDLLVERSTILGELRDQADPGASAAATPLRGRRHPAPATLARSASSGPGPDPVTLNQIRATLLTLGTVLVAVAAVIFTFVAWSRVGIGGRTAILVVLTSAAAWSARAAHRRDLSGLAEALATVTVVLCLLDAQGARTADLAGAAAAPADAYWAAALGVLALVAALAHARIPLRMLAIVAGAAAQLPIVVLADRLGTVGTTLALLAQALVALVGLRRVPRGPARVLLLMGGLAALTLGAGTAAALAYGESVAGTAVGTRTAMALLGVAAATALTAAWRHRDCAGAPELGSALATAAVLIAVHAPLHRSWGPEPATAGGVLLLLLAAAALLLPLPGPAGRPADQWRDGPLAVLGLGALTAAIQLAGPVARAVVGPLSWLGAPWSLGWDSDARSALGTPWPHGGAIGVSLGLLLIAALGAARLAPSTRSRTGAQVGAVALGAALAALVPLLCSAPYLAALHVVLAAGCAALVWAAVATRPAAVVSAATLAGATLLASALSWSLAARPATPMALAAVGLVAAGVRTVRPAAMRAPHLPAVVIAAVLVAEVGVLSRLAGASPATAGMFAVIAAALVAVAAASCGRERHVLERTALVSALVAFAPVAEHPDRAWIALLAAGTAAGVVALRPDRRPAAWLAGAFITVSTWLRLAQSGVEVPEAYTTGPALALVVAGFLARRQNCALSSWRAYGAGLAGGLVPAVLATVEDPGLLRPAVLGIVALLVTLAGARARLQAPLLCGATALGLDAMIQLAPYAQAVPRWGALAGVGLLLLWIGARFDRRLRDLRHVTERVTALA